MKWRGRNAIAAAVLAATALLALASACVGAAAPASPCPFEGAANASTAAQEKAVLCLVNRTRGARGLAPLSAPRSLARAAERKSGDILRCDEFGHEACGREFTYWFDQVNYHGCREGENLAYASGGFATPRRIFGLWMGSPGHRRNILGPYEEIGIGLRIGDLESARVHVWTQEFGNRDC